MFALELKIEVHKSQSACAVTFRVALQVGNSSACKRTVRPLMCFFFFFFFLMPQSLELILVMAPHPPLL